MNSAATSTSRNQSLTTTSSRPSSGWDCFSPSWKCHEMTRDEGAEAKPHMNEYAGETILIVEDDAGVARLEGRRLERAGYSVFTTSTAAEALRLLERQPVDLILLDYRLPEN